jgi:hypothetical protein
MESAKNQRLPITFRHALAAPMEDVAGQLHPGLSLTVETFPLSRGMGVPYELCPHNRVNHKGVQSAVPER